MGKFPICVLRGCYVNIFVDISITGSKIVHMYDVPKKQHYNITEHKILWTMYSLSNWILVLIMEFIELISNYK